MKTWIVFILPLSLSALSYDLRGDHPNIEGPFFPNYDGDI